MLINIKILNYCRPYIVLNDIELHKRLIRAVSRVVKIVLTRERSWLRLLDAFI